jgi:hypothetical protein
MRLKPTPTFDEGTDIYGPVEEIDEIAGFRRETWLLPVELSPLNRISFQPIYIDARRLNGANIGGR